MTTSEWMNKHILVTAVHMNSTSIVNSLCPFLRAVCSNSKHFDCDVRVDSIALGTRRLRLRQLLTTNDLHMQFTATCSSMQNLAHR